MQKHFFFNGVIIDVNQEKCSYTRFLGEGVTDSLVQYDSRRDIVTVDERANDYYARFATIHECICCGKYGHLAPKVIDPTSRCAAIDKMLIEAMPSLQRKYYIAKRIEMFEELLARKLNESLNDSFRESLRVLREMDAE